jgi:hypothetical protein
LLVVGQGLVKTVSGHLLLDTEIAALGQLGFLLLMQAAVHLQDITTLNNREERDMSKTNDKKIFAFIINGEVFHTMTIEKNPNTEGLIAGMLSSPTIVDASDVEGLEDYPFWKYNEKSEEFTREEGWVPAEQGPDDDYEVE